MRLSCQIETSCSVLLLEQPARRQNPSCKTLIIVNYDITDPRDYL